MRVLDSRRLTGPNLHAREPGAVAELRVAADEAGEVEAFVERWRVALARALDHLGWQARGHVRVFEDEAGGRGVELMLTAAVDRLYAATEVNEWAIARASRLAQDEPGRDELGELAALAERAAAEQAARAGALELIERAEAEGVPWLIDDEELSLGYFFAARVWPVGELPRPEQVDWPARAAAEARLAVITGTNGKTTTTRLLARMARLAGHHVGNTSTDGLFVDEQIVDAGDWTGPGGARAVLRDPKVDFAVLEAARGGLLRRGLGVPRCEVAVITNVDRDHLGEYGVFDLASMAAAKGIVARAVTAGGRIVLGADSAPLVEWARATAGSGELAAPIVWVSSAPDSPILAQARREGGEVWTVEQGFIVRRRGAESERWCEVAGVPMSFGGRARYNLENAMCACAAAIGLGLPRPTIVAALREFGRDPGDNPGRARCWRLGVPGGGQVEVLVDFAHNHAGLAAITELIRALDRPTTLCFGMAGDRPDEDLIELGASLAAARPKRVILREQPNFLRGRELGEVPARLAAGLERAGYPAARTSLAEGEVGSVLAALDEAEDGELIVVLAHTEREELPRFLSEHGAAPTQLD